MGTWGVSDILYVYETIAASPASIYSAIAQPAQLPDMPLRRDTQALHLIARIPLIQRREKCHSREEKSAFTQWFSSVYARSLKNQARQSKYPRMQILDPRTQPKLICHSSTTFIHTRSNDLIQGAGIALSVGGVNQYWSLVRPVLVHFIASESHCIYRISESLSISVISFAQCMG